MPAALLLFALLQAATVQRPAGDSAVRDAVVISGTVVDSTGAALSDARVSVTSRLGRSIQVRSGADGSFSLPDVPVPFTIVVASAGFADTSVTIETPQTALKIVLHPRGISESLTVSLHRLHQRVSTPASATVLDAEALASAAPLGLDDQLRSIPGFSLFRRSSSRVANPTTQGVTLRGMSASGASRTIVLADGIPQNDPFGGWVYWDRVPAAAVERVEVARGGSGDLYGSDALGGAIRIDTADSGARLFADGGQDGTARLSAFAARAFDGLDIRAAAEHFTTDGYVTAAPESRGSIDTEATSRHSSVYGGAGLWPGRPAGVEARAGYFTERRGNGTPFQSNATVIRHASVAGRAMGSSGLWTARGYGASQDYDQTFSAIAANRASERPTSVQHVDSKSLGFTADWVRPWARGAMFLSVSDRHVHSDLRDQALAAVVPAPVLIGAAQRTTGGTAQVSFAASPRVSLTAGVRGELWRPALANGAGAPRVRYLLPRASVAYRATAALTLRGSLQSGHRTPTINEQYRDFRVGNVLTTGNPLLGSEESTGVEAAALFSRGAGAARLTGFYSRLDDAIVSVTLQSGATILRQRQNAGRVRASGIEFETDLRLTGALAVTGSVAFIDSIFTSGAGLDGLRVPQVPRLNASAGVRVNRARLTGAAEWRYLARQFDDDRNQFALDPSSRIDARAAWSLRRRAQVFAALENVLDEEQDVGRTPLRTIGLPRTLRVGVRILR